MIGFATTPPTPMESEVGLLGRPAAEAPNKKIPQNGKYKKLIPVKMYNKGGIPMCCHVK
jgi:hypothetical protein